MITECIADNLLQMLSTLDPYIYYKAATGSIYIKFKCSELGSIRISEHEGRKKYKYRWNLVLCGKDEYYCQMDRGCKRHYYPYKMIQDMVKHIKNYYGVICRGEGNE